MIYDLNQLDSLYTELKSDLRDNIANQEVIDAMIQNYRLRISILEELLSEIKPDRIYLSSCLANAKPGCPYSSSEEMAEMIEGKTGIKVVLGTHDYH